MERNKEVYLTLGLIAYGPLREIEKLQKLVAEECKALKIVYQTVSARRLWIVKRRDIDGKGKSGKRSGEG